MKTIPLTSSSIEDALVDVDKLTKLSHNNNNNIEYLEEDDNDNVNDNDDDDDLEDIPIDYENDNDDDSFLLKYKYEQNEYNKMNQSLNECKKWIEVILCLYIILY